MAVTTDLGAPFSFRLHARGRARVTNRIASDLGAPLPRPELRIPWTLEPLDTSAYLRAGLAALRASISPSQLPGHHSAYGELAGPLQAGNVSLMIDGVLLGDHVANDDDQDIGPETRATLLDAGYFTHLVQAAEYLESAMHLAEQRFLRAAAICTRAGLEIAWRMELFLRLVEGSPSEAEAAALTKVFALRGRDPDRRDRNIRGGIEDSLLEVRRGIERSAPPSHRNVTPDAERTEDDPLTSLFTSLASAYGDLSDFVHPSARGREVAWGRTLLPDVHLAAPCRTRGGDVAIRRSIVAGCTAAVLLVDLARERWLRLHVPVQGTHLHVLGKDRFDFSEAYPEKDPTYFVKALTIGSQHLAEESFGYSSLMHFVDELHEAAADAEAWTSRNADGLLGQLTAWVLTIQELQQAVQMLATRSRFASAGVVARSTLEHAVALAQTLEDAGADGPTAAARLASFEHGDLRSSAWYEEELTERRLGAAGASAVERGVDVRGALNNLVHPNQMARLLNWAQYVRPGVPARTPRSRVVRLSSLPGAQDQSGSGPSGAPGQGLRIAKDAIAFALTIAENAMMAGLFKLGRTRR